MQSATPVKPSHATPTAARAVLASRSRVVHSSPKAAARMVLAALMVRAGRGKRPGAKLRSCELPARAWVPGGKAAALRMLRGWRR